MFLPLSIALAVASAAVIFAQAAAPVAGAPFSADQMTIRARTQPDGKVVETREMRRVYRDSKGRLWQDGTPGGASGAEPVVIIITDPVANAMYVLETPSRVAHRIELPKRPDGTSAVGFGVNIPFAAGQIRPKGNPAFKTETLGTRIMEGIEVNGNRTTVTWPAAEQSDGKEVSSVSERWLSIDFGAALLIKELDFHGDTAVQRLENIQRMEPDPALFIVPADYRVGDMDIDGKRPQ